MLVNTKELIYMFLAQEVLNEKYSGKDWRERFTLGATKFAFLDEIAEFSSEIESTWELWPGKAKIKTVDKQKALFELIDAIHYGLVVILHSYPLDEIINALNARMPPEAMAKVYEGDPHNNFADSIANFLRGASFNVRIAIGTLLDVIDTGGWLIGGLNQGDIFAAYCLKNKRNNERIEGGQVQGTYDKSKESDLVLPSLN